MGSWASAAGTSSFLLSFAAVGSIAGALLGSWLMHTKFEAEQVKKIIGIVFYAIAAKMAWVLF